MGDTNFFTIRLDDATVPVCQAALAGPRDGGTVHYLREFLTSWGKFQLTLEQGVALRAALISYSENEVREGADNHRRALHLAGALEDHIVMLQRPVVDETPEETGEDYSEAARMADLERERQNKLRDEMLREVFLGGPRKKLNIWGDVVDDDAPLSKEELRRMAKTTSAEDWRKAIEADFRDKREREAARDSLHVAGGKALKFDHSIRMPLKNQTLDAEADAILTGGSRMAYNEDMKVEGAATLLKEQKEAQQELWNAAQPIRDGVVSTVSAFLKKTAR